METYGYFGRSKKMKRNEWLLSVILIVSILFTVAFTSCNKKTKILTGKTGLYFKSQEYADNVYAINSDSMDSKELSMIVSLQGILAQEKSSIYIVDSQCKSVSLDLLESCRKQYGFAVVNTNSPWELVEKFAPSVNNKYVLYNDCSDSATSYTDLTINYAAVVAAVDHYLPIAKTIESKAKSIGLTMGADATTYTTKSVFEKYKDKLNKTYLIHQSPAQPQLRDYGIAGKAMCFYSDYYDGDANVKSEILQWADANAPILGWTQNEVNFVSANSLLSKVTVAADWSYNLSFYSASVYDKLEQSKYQQKEITPEKGKHYVAVVMSDGDNVQWMSKNFSTSEKYFGSKYRGNFKMTWTTSPALYDLAPDLLNKLYGMSTSSDEFIAGPSGVGYINAAEYNKDSLGDYAAYTAGYMKATDMEYVNLLDNYTDPAALDAFSKYDSIKGGIWSVGDYYLEGGGGIYWSNDKPFLTVRESLWRSEGDDLHNEYYGYVERIAQRINGYLKDYTKIEGYTVVLAHAWSIGSMDYIQRFVSSLDDNVELVTVGEMLDMISKNVAHKNVTRLNDISYDYFKDKLVPISSEQYNWNEIKDIPVSSERVFTFDNQKNLGGWVLKSGGLQYDTAQWVDSSSNGSPGIKLDGSDLNDALDPLPNSYIYNRFTFSSDPGKDHYLTINVCGGGSNVDTNMRVRALYEENGKMTSVVLNSSDYEKACNNFGYYLLNGQSPGKFTYDISALKGKTAILSIEQDDSGQGSGEIVFITGIRIAGNLVNDKNLTKWDINGLYTDWKKSGNVVRFSEGVSLEAASGASQISKTINVTQDTKYIKFYVRMFVRQEKPDTPPTLQCKVDGKVVRAILAESDTVSVKTDLYRCIAYDLSAYVGKSVKIEFASLSGDHAAIGFAELTKTCTTSDVRNFYSEASLKTK